MRGGGGILLKYVDRERSTRRENHGFTEYGIDVYYQGKPGPEFMFYEGTPGYMFLIINALFL